MLQAIPNLIAGLGSAQLLGLLIVGMGVGFLIVATVVGTIVPAWASVAKHRMNTVLKEKMLERGFSAEEITRVLSDSNRSRGFSDLTCASEVVLDRDGDGAWIPGLVLKRQGDRYFVHVVGSDMSENQWITADRIRFPASSHSQCASPWDLALSGGLLDPAQWCPKSNAKPAPADGELA
jgi:hypothetical protein